MTNTEARKHTTHQTIAAASLALSSVNFERMTCGELEEVNGLIEELNEDFNFWIAGKDRALAVAVANLESALRARLAA